MNQLDRQRAKLLTRLNAAGRLGPGSVAPGSSARPAQPTGTVTVKSTRTPEQVIAGRKQARDKWRRANRARINEANRHARAEDKACRSLWYRIFTVCCPIKETYGQPQTQSDDE